MIDDPKIRSKLRRLALGSGLHLIRKGDGSYELRQLKDYVVVAEEPSLRDVAIRLQRLGVLGYGGSDV